MDAQKSKVQIINEALDIIKKAVNTPSKPCQHEPAINPMDSEDECYRMRKAMHENICAKCGVRLEATWKAVE